MYTVVETSVFFAKAEKLLTSTEREAFAVYIASHPTSGAVIRGSGGVRKIRWSLSGEGKSGGLRIIYYNRLINGEIWLLTLYAKNERSTVPAHELRIIKESIENG